MDLMCVLEQFKDVATIFLCQPAFDTKVPSWRLKCTTCIDTAWVVYDCVCLCKPVVMVVPW